MYWDIHTSTLISQWVSTGSGYTVHGTYLVGGTSILCILHGNYSHRETELISWILEKNSFPGFVLPLANIVLDVDALDGKYFICSLDTYCGTLDLTKLYSISLLNDFGARF